MNETLTNCVGFFVVGIIFFPVTAELETRNWHVESSFTKYLMKHDLQNHDNCNKSVTKHVICTCVMQVGTFEHSLQLSCNDHKGEFSMFLLGQAETLSLKIPM